MTCFMKSSLQLENLLSILLYTKFCNDLSIHQVCLLLINFYTHKYNTLDILKLIRSILNWSMNLPEHSVRLDYEVEAWHHTRHAGVNVLSETQDNLTVANSTLSFYYVAKQEYTQNIYKQNSRKITASIKTEQLFRIRQQYGILHHHSPVYFCSKNGQN